MAAPHRIVILGGGFAGIRLARRLGMASTRRHFSVSLVNRDATHTYTPGLYQLAGAVTDATRRKAMDRSTALPIRRILAGLPVALVLGDVVSVDANSRTVDLKDGRKLTYDTLVVALGSEAAYYGIPGVKENAITLKSIKDADRINRTIATLMRGRAEPVRVTIAGGGPTGVELSAMLAQKLRSWQAGTHVTLIEGTPALMCGFSTSVQSYVTRQLTQRGVTVITGHMVKEAVHGSVLLDDGSRIEHDVLIWAAGTQSPLLISTLPFVCDHGRIATDVNFACVPNAGGTQKHVYALGDATCFHYAGEHAPWTAQVAIQQADHLAKNILNRFSGKPEKPFKLPLQNFVVPLGTTGGIASYLHIPFYGLGAQLLSYAAEIDYLLHMLSIRDIFWIIRRRLQAL